MVTNDVMKCVYKENAMINTQYYKILQYLKEGNTLTGLEALNKFRCIRLSARISEMIRAGHKIESKFVPVYSREPETGLSIKKMIKRYWYDKYHLDMHKRDI